MFTTASLYPARSCMRHDMLILEDGEDEVDEYEGDYPSSDEEFNEDCILMRTLTTIICSNSHNVPFIN